MPAFWTSRGLGAHPSHLVLLVGLGSCLSWSCANVSESAGGAGGRLGATGGATGTAGTAGEAPSGGRSGATGGVTQVNDAGVITRDAANDGACGLTKFMVERTPAEILLLLDRSASMKEKPSGATVATSKWDLVTPAVSGVIASTGSMIPWAYKSFPEGEGKECAADSVTSAIDVKMAPNNGGVVTTAIATTTPEGNGTPTGDAVKAAATYLMGLKDGARHYILLATDGEPSCPSSDADDFAVKAVADAASAGINTFVVGIATTSKSTTATLNMLANAGGVGTSDPNSPATRYYLASTSADLIAALQKITGQVISCDFAFASPPPVPENIAVDVAGSRLAQSDTDGWSYADAGHHGIRINGASCDKLQTSTSSAVQVTFGCPDIVIP